LCGGATQPIRAAEKSHRSPRLAIDPDATEVATAAIRYSLLLRTGSAVFLLSDRSVFASTTPATMKKLLALLALAGIANVAAADSNTKSVDANAGNNKVAMCIGCHGIPGYKATFPEVYQVPMIGGQSTKYIENALRAYQKGERKHPSMRGIAISLSDQDIADVAAYYAQQK
jgi:cytochrome c553